MYVTGFFIRGSLSGFKIKMNELFISNCFRINK